jgi:TonB family protein
MRSQSGAFMAGSQNRGAIGKYQLVASLAQGGMSKVYLALVAGPAHVNKLMVLKVLASEMLHGPEGGLDLFWDEARLAARLVHPNIVHTYEVGEAEGNYFLAMEHLDGQTLRVVQSRSHEEPLPCGEELRILSEVARGLHYAHNLEDFHGAPLNVVHRDVSPQNVFVTYDGQVKLIDFGIAKTRDAEHETRVGLIKGKLNYIAPEQLRAEQLDRRADVFSLGVMLWETVAGRRFAGGAHVTEVAKIQARLKGEEPNIRSVRPDVPEALAIIIDRAIHLDRVQRWQDAAAFADALDAHLESTQQRPGARTLAAWMQQHFAQDRAAMHRLIEERVQLILESPAAGEGGVPAFPLHEGTSSGSWTGRERSGIKGRSDQGVLEQADAVRASAGQSLRLSAIGAATVLAVGAMVTLLMSADAAAPSSPVVPIGTPAALAASSTIGPVQPAQAGSSSAEAPAQVNIRISALPLGAQVSIDGAPVSLPFSGDFVKSSALHRIEATAKRYKPSARLVSFAQDQIVEFQLAPVVEASEGRAAERPRATADMQGAAPAPAAGQQPRPAPSDDLAKAQGMAPIADMGTAKSGVDAVLQGAEDGTGNPVNKPVEALIPSKELPGNRFPAYPNSAQRHSLAGTVVVAFDVLPDGTVAKPEIIEGPKEFHETVLKTVLTWRFQPATLGGKPVSHRRTKTIKFDLDDA